MQTGLGHLQINIQPRHQPFYKDVMAFLGWTSVHESEGILGVQGTNGASLWFVGQMKDVANDYDGPGVNHIAISAPVQSDIDQAAAFLKERGVELLFETPRHRPEFSGGDGQTYYQVMFSSPDGILFEVVYTGPKSA